VSPRWSFLTADGEQLVQSAAGGMRLSAWLATRTFELTVHTRDIAAATGIAATSTSKALADAASLAARVAVTVGTGKPVLRGLTGRGTLPKGFSVLSATARPHSVEGSATGTQHLQLASVRHCCT
jgi:hypothetical protein